MSSKPWKPEYPGRLGPNEQEHEPAYVWWTPGEYEDDLAGYHTVYDRMEYQRGLPGPFRRRLSLFPPRRDKPAKPH